MFKDQTKFHELVDPLLKGKYETKALNQAVAIAAMCLQEEPMVRPLMTDVVMALGFLVVPLENVQLPPPPPPPEAPPEEEASGGDRQRAVEEAIKWGSSSRRKL